MFLAYGYPVVRHIPSIKVAEIKEPVHVFRVDITDYQVPLPFWDTEPSDHYTLTRLDPAVDGTVPSQTRVSLLWHYDVLIFMPCPSYGRTTDHTLRLRLYRYGYQTVEIKPWQNVDSVTWEAAPDLSSREKAADALVATADTDEGLMRRFPADALEQLYSNSPRKDPARDPLAFRQLDPGSASYMHRSALYFAADEYDKVAALEGPDDPESERIRERCRDKAKLLRHLAEK